MRFISLLSFVGFIRKTFDTPVSKFSENKKEYMKQKNNSEEDEEQVPDDQEWTRV